MSPPAGPTGLRATSRRSCTSCCWRSWATTCLIRPGSGELPTKLAGDPGNGQVDDYPILTRGDRVVVRGYTVGVVSDDGDTHTVVIVKTRD